MKSHFALVLVPGLLFLASCGSHIVPAQSHAPTTPDQVKIYQNAPSKYEILDTVSLVITPDMTWDQSGNANTGFDQLKQKAAALGANGLLLDQHTPTATYQVQAGYSGTFYNVPMHLDPKTAVAEAIFVLKE